MKKNRHSSDGSLEATKGMRACMVAYTFYESDNRVRRYAETLVKRGDHVDVIALRQERDPRHEVIEGVNVHRIQKRVINERRKIAYFLKIILFLVNSFIRLTLKHLKNRYDLIHVHSVPDFEVFAAVIPKLTGSKVILDIHDIVPEFYASKFKSPNNSVVLKWLTMVERLSTAFADHVIISNDIWYKTLTSRSVNEDKCTVILNYPTDIFYKRPARGRASARFIIIYPGTLNWHQGVDIAVKAFSIIKDRAPEAEFHIYGDGESKEALMNLVLQLGLEGRVLFNGILPLEGIADIMGRSDLGVVPKRANAFGNEAFSTKILEFMALGVPVIVSRTKIDQFYFDDSLVTFFKPDDEKDLAEKMLLLMTDTKLREKTTSNALKFIDKNSWSIKKKIYLDIVDSLLG